MEYRIATIAHANEQKKDMMGWSTIASIVKAAILTVATYGLSNAFTAGTVAADMAYGGTMTGDLYAAGLTASEIEASMALIAAENAAAGIGSSGSVLATQLAAAGLSASEIEASMALIAAENAAAGIGSSGSIASGEVLGLSNFKFVNDLKSKLAKTVIEKALGFAFQGAENAGGQMSIDYMGANDNGLISTLAGLMQGGSQWANVNPISARNGLDYVPYDGMPAILHEGERVQTKGEAEAGRGGIALTIEVPVCIDGREIDHLTARRVLSGGELQAAIDRRIRVMVN